MAAPSPAWREVSDIPGLIPFHELEVHAVDDPARRHPLENTTIEIRWRKMVGLEWIAYQLIKVARVYGETHLLLEKKDGSRSWSALSDSRFIRRVS